MQQADTEADVRITVTADISAELRRRLRVLAANQNMTIGTIVNEALESYLAKFEAK